MSKEYNHEYLRKMRLSAPKVESEGYPRPLIETDPEKWHEMFDCCKERKKEPDYLILNIVYFCMALTIIAAYHLM